MPIEHKNKNTEEDDKNISSVTTPASILVSDLNVSTDSTASTVSDYYDSDSDDEDDMGIEQVVLEREMIDLFHVTALLNRVKESLASNKLEFNLQKINNSAAKRSLIDEIIEHRSQYAAAITQMRDRHTDSSGRKVNKLDRGAVLSFLLLSKTYDKWMKEQNIIKPEKKQRRELFLQLVKNILGLNGDDKQLDMIESFLGKSRESVKKSRSIVNS